MKIIKKTISVLLSILLVILVTPFNNVYASASASVLIINCQMDGVDKVAKFKINGDQQLEKDDLFSGPDLPEGLEATWDATQQRIILKVKQNTELKGILGDGHEEAIIKCAEDLEIKSENNSKLHLTVHPKQVADDPEKEYAFIISTKNIYINDMNGAGPADRDNAGIYCTLAETQENRYSQSEPYKNIEGMIARNFSIKNSSIVISTRNSAFYSTYDKNDPVYINNDSNNNNRLYIDNSKIAYDGAYHYADQESAVKDPAARAMCFFTYANSDNFEGDVTIKNNSVIRIGYHVELPTVIVSGESAINLLKESVLNVDSSVLAFQSYQPISLASVGKVNITNCKKTSSNSPIVLNGYYDGSPIFMTNSINITNSDFKLSTEKAVISRPFLETHIGEGGTGTGGGGGTPTPTQPATTELNISEDDNLYEGSIKVNDSSNSTYAFSRMQPSPEPVEVPVYTKINLSLAGTKNAAVSNVTGPTTYTVVIDPSVSGTFNFETAANGVFSTTPLSQCKNFQILANPDPGTGGGGTGGNTGGGSSSNHSSHAVPNTSVSK